MFRRPGTGRSKASADTLCQKCLNRGHYSYECTVSAQQRPYKPRPSRTQQLLNPQLKPKLTTEIPNVLLRKKGVADEILAKKEKERGRKSRRESSRKRSRSYSSDSESVSTISTNRSPSSSPPPKRIENGRAPSMEHERLGKRGRRSMSSDSDRSTDRAERYTRRRMSSFSPDRRGRSRRRSRSSPMDTSPDGASRQPRKQRSRSKSLHRRGGRRFRSLSEDPHGKRARNISMSRSPLRSPNQMDISTDDHMAQDGTSPGPRGRWAGSHGHRPTQSSSRSRSPYRRGSISPYRRRTGRSPSPYRNPDGGRRHHFDDRHRPPVRHQPPPPLLPAAPRERSLSPYSKRVALTRQTQGGH